MSFGTDLCRRVGESCTQWHAKLFVHEQVEFKVEKPREKEKTKTSTAHMDAMNVTKRQFGFGDGAWQQAPTLHAPPHSHKAPAATIIDMCRWCGSSTRPGAAIWPHPRHRCGRVLARPAESRLRRGPSAVHDRDLLRCLAAVRRSPERTENPICAAPHAIDEATDSNGAE